MKKQQNEKTLEIKLLHGKWKVYLRDGQVKKNTSRDKRSVAQGFFHYQTLSDEEAFEILKRRMINYEIARCRKDEITKSLAGLKALKFPSSSRKGKR